MKTKINLLIESELDDIFKKIVTNRIENSKGYYWEKDDAIKGKQISEDIYSGNSGIILFLLDYYNYKKSTKVKEVILKAATWLKEYCITKESNNFSFYSGRTGSIYILLNVQKKFPTEFSIGSLIDQVDKVRVSHFEGRVVNDLLNGLAGTILGLVLIFEETRMEKIKIIIFKHISWLISNMDFHDPGVFWDRSRKISKGLCGISHGSSGIGLLFLLLAKCFNQLFFYELAKKTFEYEDYFFDSSKNNWPDFRNGYYDNESHEKYIRNYEIGNYDFFIKSSFMTAWCHGSPGIGLTRILAFEYTGMYKQECQNIIDSVTSTVNVKSDSYTLCHNSLGKCSVLIEWYNRFGGDQYLDLFKKGCLMAIDEKNRIGYYKSGNNTDEKENLSYFLGLSGIGHSFLMALGAKVTISPLLPSVNFILKDEAQWIDWKYTMNLMLNKYYPLSTKLLGEKATIVLNQDKKISLDYINSCLEKAIFEDKDAQFIFSVEKRKNLLNTKIESYSLMSIAKSANYLKYLQHCKIGNIISCSIVLNKEAEFFTRNKLLLIIYPCDIEFKILRIDLAGYKLLLALKNEIKLKHIYSKLYLNTSKEINNILHHYIRLGIILIK